MSSSKGQIFLHLQGIPKWLGSIFWFQKLWVVTTMTWYNSWSCWLPCHYESGGAKIRREHCRSWLIWWWPSIGYETRPWMQEWLKYYVWYLYIFLSLELDNWSSVLKDYCLRSASLIVLIFLIDTQSRIEWSPTKYKAYSSKYIYFLYTLSYLLFMTSWDIIFILPVVTHGHIPSYILRRLIWWNIWKGKKSPYFSTTPWCILRSFITRSIKKRW